MAAKNKAPARDPGVLLRDLKPSTLEAAQAEADSRGVTRADVIREWLDRQAGDVCPTCKGSGRRR